MKSRYFTDMQGLDVAWRDGAPDQISVCLRISRAAYERALTEAWRQGLTSGAYIERLLAHPASGLPFFPPFPPQRFTEASGSPASSRSYRE